MQSWVSRELASSLGEEKIIVDVLHRQVKCVHEPFIITHEYVADLDHIIEHVCTMMREDKKCFARVNCVQRQSSL